MEVSASRLRGWKSIATYLGVTQSTAIRWSKRPGFPISRPADGGSVYALVAELDQWLHTDTAAASDVGSCGDIEEMPVAAVALPLPGPRSASVLPPVAPTNRRSSARRIALILLPVAVCIMAVVGARYLLQASDHARSLTLSTPLMRRYLHARAAWAERTPASVRQAVDEFRLIVADHPDFQPGFTGLADAYILSCEAGTMDRAQAFRLASAAVSTGLALAPDDADANRIEGFLTYWTTRDMARAKPIFERAAASDDAASKPLLHLWYGNALIDAGDVADGLAELQAAARASPDSAAVLTDYAIAQWQAGDTGGAVAGLSQVERRFPHYAAPFGAEALFALSWGDVPRYLAQSERWASLIGDAAQGARVTREQAAFDGGGTPALLRLIADAPAMVSPFWQGGNLPRAIAASLLGDRPRMVRILASPGLVFEHWRRLRFPAAPLVRWRNDPGIASRLDVIFASPHYAAYPMR